MASHRSKAEQAKKKASPFEPALVHILFKSDFALNAEAFRLRSNGARPSSTPLPPGYNQ
jgi:hypothetical protein